MIYVLYQTPPLDITWGLVRDTRESLIGSGPWNGTDNPALYYYLLDFEEGCSGPLLLEPGQDPNIIRWHGDQHDGLPESVSDIPVAHRHNPTSIPPAATPQNEHHPPVEPRRYADPS